MLIEPLHDYFLNDGIDDAGRTLRHVIGKSDDWLESKHDFIQWMFPLVEKSGANPGAPLIDVNLVTLFRINERPRNNMLLGFDRMLKFYGLQREGTAIAKAKNWNERKEYWFTQPTHNDLRISRMLKSMTILSLEEYAKSFFDALMRLAAEPDCGFSEESVGYWKAAIVKRSISFEEPDPKYENIPNTGYIQAPMEEIREAIASLWMRACHLSDLEQASEDEKFRWRLHRFQLAVLARKSGIMDSATFSTECDLHTQVLADAMGGVAVKLENH